MDEIEIKITPEERDLILDLTFADEALTDRLKIAVKWHSNSGHLEKDDIETNKFEVSYDNTKEELFKAV